MDNCPDWDSVLHFVADPLDLDLSDKRDDDRASKPSFSHTTLQVPTPPVSTQYAYSLICYIFHLIAFE
jgi:hypothetical protein